MFQIEDNIPAPTSARVRQKGDFALTVDVLEVGKSFFAPGKQPKGVYAALSKKKHPGKTFRTAPETKDGVAGVRVWRTA